MDRIDSVHRHKGGIPHRHIVEICLNNPYDTNLFSATQLLSVICGAMEQEQIRSDARSERSDRRVVLRKQTSKKM